MEGQKWTRVLYLSWNGTTLLFTYSMSNPTVPLLSTLKWSLDFHDFFAKNLPFKAISSELIKTYFSSFLQYLITLCLVDFLSYFPGIFTPAWAPLKPFFLLWKNFKWQKLSICKWDSFFFFFKFDMHCNFYRCFMEKWKVMKWLWCF